MSSLRSRACLVTALLLLILPLPSLSPRSVQANPPALDQRLPERVEHVYTALAKAFSPDRAMEIVTFMSRSWRLAGNPAFEASQELIARRLDEAGFRAVASAAEADSVVRSPESEVRSRGGVTPGAGLRTPQDKKRVGYQWYEQFATTMPAWEPVAATLAVNDSVELDMSRPLDRVSLCINSFSTPAGGVRAPLVLVGRGVDPADYANVEVRGKIVLGEADARRLSDMAIRQRGALGVLSTAAAGYTKPNDTPDLVQWSGIPYDEALHAFGFKISRRLAARLKERLAAGPVMLKVDITTRFHPRPNRTLVAEIPGRTRPDERVVLVAHVQEPGANDNASGCATLLEVARSLAAATARGAIPPPARTLTFLWGDEISESRQWLTADPSRAGTVRYAFSLDMTGEDVTKTGGTFLIEKQPDPSAVWLRPSDPHTEWGSSRVAAETLKGNLLNDLHLAICLRRARDTGWVVKTNPYEGGSDHSVFLASGVPALLDWHFTDRYYHTNLDAPDTTSPTEMANVGIAVGTTAWLLAAANDRDAAAVVDLVEQAALARLALEARQSAEALVQVQGAAEARAKEEALFSAWQKWYVEALQSVLVLPARTASAGASGRSPLQRRVDQAIERVRAAKLTLPPSTATAAASTSARRSPSASGAC